MSLIYNIISLSNDLESIRKEEYKAIIKPLEYILILAVLLGIISLAFLTFVPNFIILLVTALGSTLLLVYPKMLIYEKNIEIVNEDILKLISCVNVDDIVEYFEKDYDFKNESDEFNYIFIKICNKLKYKEVLSDMSVVKIQRLIKKELPNHKINQYVTNLMIEELSNKNNNIIEIEGVVISNE